MDDKQRELCAQIVKNCDTTMVLAAWGKGTYFAGINSTHASRLVDSLNGTIKDSGDRRAKAAAILREYLAPALDDTVRKLCAAVVEKCNMDEVLDHCRRMEYYDGPNCENVHLLVDHFYVQDNNNPAGNRKKAGEMLRLYLSEQSTPSNWSQQYQCEFPVPNPAQMATQLLSDSGRWEKLWKCWQTIKQHNTPVQIGEAIAAFKTGRLPKNTPLQYAQLSGCTRSLLRHLKLIGDGNVNLGRIVAGHVLEQLINNFKLTGIKPSLIISDDITDRPMTATELHKILEADFSKFEDRVAAHCGLTDDPYKVVASGFRKTGKSALEDFWTSFDTRRGKSSDKAADLSNIPRTKENTMSHIAKLFTTTFVQDAGGNKYDVAKLDDDTVYRLIADTEAEINRLGALEHKPASVAKKIDELKASIDELIKLVDARS
jgi:hypothetical protein